ncbi:hypothetical protein GCM10010912_54960 [Paenibacillus albidus]|uniref:Lipoprotein n=1 Tax=Paenibacillus albidus TaxID=2041023 RepID=A0A917CYV5_9BACL|nr:hypothetical protein [Paenibacillus albidus]GGG03276.1 hypothetical protein GCM10010912_54960 [Paenibacillus albidus]
MKKGFAVVILIMLLSGCMNKPKALHEQDLCLMDTQNENQKICYGMSRAEIEAIVGAGTVQETTFAPDKDGTLVSYEDNLGIFYKDDRAKDLSVLDQNTLEQLAQGKLVIEKGRYKTERGAALGMKESEIAELYGEDYVKDSTFIYIYDSARKAYITDPGQLKQIPDDAEGIYEFSASVGTDGSETLVFGLTFRDYNKHNYRD